MKVNLDTDLWYCHFKTRTDFLKIQLIVESINKRKTRYLRNPLVSHKVYLCDTDLSKTTSRYTQLYNQIAISDRWHEVTLDYILKYDHKPIGST